MFGLLAADRVRAKSDRRHAERCQPNHVVWAFDDDQAERFESLGCLRFSQPLLAEEFDAEAMIERCAEMVAPRLWFAPQTVDGAYTSNDAKHRQRTDAPTLVQIWQFCTSESQPGCACPGSRSMNPRAWSVTIH